MWNELRPLKDLGWVLYGGTAIALRLGHRASVDFDFFNDGVLHRAALNSACSLLASALVLQERSDTLTLLVSAHTAAAVKISFFAGIGFGRTGTPQLTEDGVAVVASSDDLLAHKLKVLLQRVETKDYVDIAALIRAGVKLDRALASARAMYGVAFQPSEALKALVYFEGGDLQTLTRPVKDALIGAVQSVRDLPEVVVLARGLSATV